MRSRFQLSLPLLVASTVVSLGALHCGGATTGDRPDGGPGGVPTGSPTSSGGPGTAVHPPAVNPDAVGATAAEKADILFVVDDSAGMADKGKLLGASVGTLLRSVTAKTKDVHVGVITSSLGSMGGDVCAGPGAQNRLAHLSTVGEGNAPVTDAAGGFLYYGAGITDVDTLVADTEQLIRGVGEGGCGFEAQLESTYRFLVQPDPWASIAIDSKTMQAQYAGVDGDLLAQRKAFLRPDSLVVVVLLTDENDSSVDPRSVGGQGWAFENTIFPGSTISRGGGGTTAPRPTSACATDPGSADCTSCGFAATCNVSDPACQTIKSDPQCQQNGGYYEPTDDQLNVRFFRMKERFGLDPQFPLSRYVDGFTKQRAPSRDGEHVLQGLSMSDYLGNADCTNPLFASSLPGGSGDELCKLPQGPRGKELVLFTVIGGVPESLARPAPAWTKIVGANPGAYDFSGLDLHMIPSTTPRPGLVPPSATRGDNGTDPVNGREWETNGGDLQYACTFTLPTPETCQVGAVCDCSNAATNPPICSATLGERLKGKATPTSRELEVAQRLGAQAVVGSICPTDPSFGYAAPLGTLADLIALRLK